MPELLLNPNKPLVGVAPLIIIFLYSATGAFGNLLYIIAHTADTNGAAILVPVKYAKLFVGDVLSINVPGANTSTDDP